MGDKEAKSDDICTRFSKLHWHDSRLLDIKLLRVPDQRKYNLHLDLDLIVGYTDGRFERINKTVLFLDCRLVQMDFDIIGLVACGGDIGAATCYTNPSELLREPRNRFCDLSLAESDNPLPDCFGFFIDMIPPGGQLIVYSDGFEFV